LEIRVEPAQPKSGKKTPETHFCSISDSRKNIELSRLNPNFEQKPSCSNFLRKNWVETDQPKFLNKERVEPAQLGFLKEIFGLTLAQLAFLKKK